MLFSSVIDQDVQRSKLTERFLYSAVAKLLVTYVAGDCQTATILTRHQSFRFFSVLMLIEIDDRHVRSFLSEGHRHGSPDSAVSAGDERDLTVELSRAMPSVVLHLWPRPHRRFEARLAAAFIKSCRTLRFWERERKAEM